jgi:hypothetical protein
MGLITINPSIRKEKTNVLHLVNKFLFFTIRKTSIVFPSEKTITIIKFKLYKIPKIKKTTEKNE